MKQMGFSLHGGSSIFYYGLLEASRVHVLHRKRDLRLKLLSIKSRKYKLNKGYKYFVDAFIAFIVNLGISWHLHAVLRSFHRPESLVGDAANKPYQCCCERHQQPFIHQRLTPGYREIALEDVFFSGA
ncbi:transmembrane protein, putative [Medicago truncatula]|uniref:Transmembrane protein, putative n=1 Tax=Medicago truncatula TaxID=3880 RepID=A0A072VIQ9_MEDTR|nr:transmembrane protein, putative [Medicago truncatula]